MLKSTNKRPPIFQMFAAAKLATRAYRPRVKFVLSTVADLQLLSLIFHPNPIILRSAFRGAVAEVCSECVAVKLASVKF